jgi:hypothetical protein
MAADLSIDDLREALRAGETVAARAFDILRAISILVNADGTDELAREMVLRALSHRKQFADLSMMLDALARAVGLFPYVDPDDLDLRDRIAYEFHRPLNMPADFVFHREQAEIYRRLLAGESVILSAPTSFGKSRIIDAMISAGRFKNIAVIVPTLALIDETRRRLSIFSDRYKIVTHMSQEPGGRNIFVFTAERAVAYDRLPRIDFFAIDEFYKIGAMEEDESRTIALNQAFYKLRKGGGQFYLLGPNIQQIPIGLEAAFRCYFFLTKFATVVAEQSLVGGHGNKDDRLVALLKELVEPTLIFCSSPSRVNSVAQLLLDSGVGIDGSELRAAAGWTAVTYHPDWIFGRALLRGIGIHHGRLPRALGQYVVRMFNEDKIRFLICTSTLIEGVNTKAKNVVIYDNSIANRPIDYFTFNNIKGRSGRMFQHFVGHVFLFNDPPQEQLPFVDFPVFTQDAATPAALLIQLDHDDLSDPSRERVQRYSEEEVIPLNLIRQNHTIDPDAQIRLARFVRDHADRAWPLLAWNSFPKYDQLKYACEVIWNHLISADRRYGVFSGSQLAHKTWQLWQTRNAARRVLDELTPGKYAARSPDEAVERVLQFERNWAGFELPRCLRALSRIQAYVLQQKGLPQGDYSSFASQAESLFRSPVVAALDEYGIPLQVAEKLQAHLRSTTDLDVALKQLNSLDLRRVRLTAFERELVADAQRAI